jgi:hypothetical protein
MSYCFGGELEMTKITRVEVIDENGRSYVNWEDDNDVSVSYQDDGRTLKVFVNKVKPKPQTLFDVIRNLGYSVDCSWEIVDAVEEFEKQKEREMIKRNLKTSLQEMVNGDVRPIDDVVKEAKEEQKWDVVRESVKWCEENPEKSVEDYLTPKTPEKTEQSLKTAFKEAQQTEKWKETQKKIDTPKESWMDKPVEELVDKLMENPPDCLKFQLGKTLEQIVTRWWCDTFTGPHEKWSMEECIDDLIDQIEWWFPREQSSEGSQDIYAVVAVEAHNELLQKIKSKLRNKKDT